MLDGRSSRRAAEPKPATSRRAAGAALGVPAMLVAERVERNRLSAHVLSWRGDAVSVTFNPEVFDRHPNSVQLLSYGNPLLDELLASAGDPRGSDDPEGIGLFRATGAAPLSLFVQPGPGGARAVLTLAELREAMSEEIEAWEGSKVEAALSLFVAAQGEAARKQERVEGDRRRGERLALLEEARQVLVRTALLELAEARSRTSSRRRRRAASGASPCWR